MTPEEKRQWAAETLRRKARQSGALPQKQDFDEVTRSKIKAFLGPWPRALEAAGLKPAAPPKSKRRKRQSKGERA